ncbi:MAG: hypothetical protein KUG81_09410 [Gammaproteobacteria bacterium]|nr:hypothetical protein [Gammaproteobacteria bacterium]
MSTINPESAAVQSYLVILQGVISRMATNSSACKTWCITLVSAILVIVADKAKPEYALLALMPAVLFLLLDSYYLGLERGFRDLYNQFIKKLHSNTATLEDTFVVNPGGGTGHILLLSLKALFSVSVWPFYGLLSAMILVAKYYVL